MGRTHALRLREGNEHLPASAAATQPSFCSPNHHISPENNPDLLEVFHWLIFYILSIAKFANLCPSRKKGTKPMGPLSPRAGGKNSPIRRFQVTWCPRLRSKVRRYRSRSASVETLGEPKVPSLESQRKTRVKIDGPVKPCRKTYLFGNGYCSHVTLTIVYTGYLLVYFGNVGFGWYSRSFFLLVKHARVPQQRRWINHCGGFGRNPLQNWDDARKTPLRRE